VSNTARFQRVDRRIHRHIRSGELWFVGRRAGRVIWQRLRTPDLLVARATVAMMDSQTNGNSAIYLIVDGKEQPVADAKPVNTEKPLRRMRQTLVEAGTPTPPTKPATVAVPLPSSAAPTLDELLVRWRQGKAGLMPSTEDKLDNSLKLTRRYLDTNRTVTVYTPQDIRDAFAKARMDKKQGHRRLKGQTINEAIWRPLKYAFDLALEEGHLARSPMAMVKREKLVPINRAQHAWTDAEHLLEDVKQRAHESYLELKFMLLLGVGQAEARDLTGGSVKWSEAQITFVRRKTGKQYTVPIYPWAKEFIKSEIEPRLKRDQPVFDWRNPRKALATSCRRLGLARYEIRSLRRTLIVHLIQQRVDIRLIAKWQGHADARLILSRYGAFIDAGYEKEALATLGKSTVAK